jgi:ABC-type transport system substrate-binding protein
MASRRILKRLTWIVSLTMALSPCLAQDAEETPPARRSKLDVEEEEPPAKAPSSPAPAQPPAAKSKLDINEEEPPPPKKAPSPGAPPPAAAPGKAPASVSAGGASGKDSEKPPDEEGLYDTVFLNDRPVRIRLHPHVLSFPLNEAQKNMPFVFNEIVSNEQGKTVHRVPGRAMTRRIVYYEERMLNRAAAALQVKPARLVESGATFSTAGGTKSGLDEAERLLVKALSEHDSAAQQNLRQGLEWDAKFRKPLLQGLANVRLSRIDQQINEQQWGLATAACDALLAELKRSSIPPEQLRGRFERIFLTQGREAFGQQRFADARQALAEIGQRYPFDSGTATREFRDELIAHADKQINDAESLIAAGRFREARELVDLAAQVWPELAAIDRTRDRLGDHPLLECAYSELPVHLSPLSARSPVERHAVALMFESLVRWSDDARLGPHYECQLARGRPIPLAHGREFVLHRSRWSDTTDDDPKVCTAEDVRWTAEKLLANANVPGHLPAWRNLVAGVINSRGQDPFTAAVRLKLDHWQPLSLMDFKVLPKHHFPRQGTPAELAAFDGNPVGTGPFKLAGRSDSAVRFVANPQFRTPGLPKIREISFNRLDPTRAVEAFLQDKVHLIYGLNPDHVKQLRLQGRTVRTLSNRSVWFLAPRYRRGARKTQLDNVNLRLAIAHGIDRTVILDQNFRPQVGIDHAPLTGPYPKSSWAANPLTPQFDRTKAGAFAELAQQELKKIEPLRLAYPDSDLATEKACAQMRSQLAELGIAIELTPIAANEFHGRIVNDGDFDLAYWRPDFEDESYWLWPLLDPAGMGPGGANFMQVTPDQDLLRLFQELELHKQFSKVEQLTHQIHDHLARNAVIIPLWQLDSYVAVHQSLENVKLEPVGLFSEVQQWSIRKNR